MFKNLLSKVGWGELPSSFGFSVGEKVDLPFSWSWDLHKGLKKADGSAVSIFICGKKDLDPSQAMAAKHAEQISKSLRHPNILQTFNSIETDSGFYIVTEEVVPLLSFQPAEGDERTPAVWGLYQALDGLSFLHTSGFTHGLFGPLSIFVTPRGDFRVGGFELCQKGLDTGTAIASRRRVGPTASGWPEPPAALQQGGVPSIGIDMWGAAVLTAYVFGSARNGRYGLDVRIDMARAVQDVPPELRKTFEELQNPKPLRGRSPLAEATNLTYFQQNSAVKVFSFLAHLHIKSSEEKDAFFEGLPGLMEGLSQGVQTRQVLPELLAAQRFPGQEAAQVLPAILKIGMKLKEDEFREKVAPLVAQLFASPDRAVRFRLLSSFGEMVEFLDDAMINDKIFPECVNGFTDSNGPIREATVKAMIYFVPRLKPKLVEGRVVKLLVKLLQDPEASIRTNAVICCGRISGSLPQSCASQTLMSVIGNGMKDPFGPCRSSALHTLSATSSIFTPEELSQKLLPGVCHRLVDPDQAVADVAFSVLGTVQEVLRQQLQERRAAMAASAEGNIGGLPTQSSASASAPGGATSAWSSWALSTVGSVVGQKIMGSMGPAKSDGAGNAAPAMPSPEQPPAPPQHGSGGARSGMQLATGNTAKASASSGSRSGPGGQTSSVDLDLDDLDGPGDGWGGGDVDLGGASAASKLDDDFGDDFFNDFDDAPMPTSASGGSLSAMSSGSSQPAVRAKAASTPASAGPPKATSMPSMSLAAKAKPATAPKAKSEPKLASADDDFWKEFDM